MHTFKKRVFPILMTIALSSIFSGSTTSAIDFDTGTPGGLTVEKSHQNYQDQQLIKIVLITVSAAVLIMIAVGLVHARNKKSKTKTKQKRKK